MNRFALAAFCSFTLASSTFAATVPFTEDFVSDTANWGADPAVLTAPTYLTTGGPSGAGDSYISNLKTFGSSTLGQVLFRGQATFNSSNGAITGNWVTAGVTSLAYWVRHDASEALEFGLRIAKTNNNPGYGIMTGTFVQPNVWTKVTVPISVAAAAGWTYEGGPGNVTTQFNDVFGSVAYVQPLAARGAFAEGTQVTFQLDDVSLVPEPSSWALACLGGFAGLAAIRFRRKAVASAT